MNNDNPLSGMYSLYVTGNLPRKDFEGRLFQFLLENSERYRAFGGNRDEWNEFISWLYPRLVRAIDLYRDINSSFDAYIGSVIYSASKEYRSRKADHYITEFACWQARAEEMKLLESEPDYLVDLKPVPVLKQINPRQILILLLKSYSYVTDDYVKHIAKTIGMETEVIWNMIDEIRNRNSWKEAKVFGLKDRLYSQHYRCLAYQKRMDYSQPETDYYERMKDRFERAKKRYYSMKKRLGGMRLCPTNKMIAEVMGIPKGTVDSSLYILKNRLASDQDKSA